MEAIARLATALAARYRIERELGAGGMATVYLADDIKHARKVAVKVLRPELAAVIGAERFLAEIRTTANLQHPHILPLHDSGDADGLLFYVMPYVEGESLRDRLNRERQLAVGDAVRIACEVGSALDYAHRHGVIHRDIKPENVLLHDGRALVADFGIALAASKAGGATRMTETGMSLGTPHYMSPEQAMGERDITARSDVYALGAIAYEMLTGEPPFTGPSAQAIIARVVTEHPRSLSSQRHTIPEHVEAAVLTALEKLPADRFATAAEFVTALGNPGYAARGATTRRVLSAPLPAARRERPMLLGLVAGLAALAAWGWLRPVPQPRFPVVHLPLALPEAAPLRDGPGSPVTLSPDGSKLVYVGWGAGTTQLFVRVLTDFSSTPLAGTENARLPFFSPDGEWVGFVADGKLRRVPINGGPVTAIADVPSLLGVAWGGADLVVFATDDGLHAVSAGGGTPRLLLAPDSGARSTLRWPAVSPDGRTVVFTRWREDGGRLFALSVQSGDSRPLELTGTYPRLTAKGDLVYVTADGVAFTAPLDARRRRVTGPPRSIAKDIRVGGGGAAKLGLSLSGSLVYLAGARPVRELVMVDRTGRAEPLSMVPNLFEAPRFSPDGRKIALGIADPIRGTRDVWVHDLVLNTLGRVTFDSISEYPEWSHDGRWIMFATRRSGNWDLWRAASDGSGVEEPLLLAPGNQEEILLTRDGRSLIYREHDATTGRNLVYRTTGPDTTSTPIVRTPFQESSPALAPDDRWLAYSSNETGRTEVYVRQFPGPGGRTQISAGGGTQPRWSPRGNELFYRIQDSLIALRMDLRGDAPRIETRTALPISFPFGGLAEHAHWDVHPDGRRFVFPRAQPRAEGDDLRLVLHLLNGQ